MEEIYDVVIIGAGSAGLKAYRECRKRTERVLVIHDGPKGTTCAREGCMPSKALIHTAKLMHARSLHERCGMRGAVEIDRRALMRHVREQRDYFLSFALKETDAVGERLIEGRPRFLDAQTLEVNGRRIRTRATIIATGSRASVPDGLAPFADRIITSHTLFEQEDLPPRIGVIGMGVTGTELGQALARLAIQVTAAQHDCVLGGLSDPEVAKVAVDILRQEMELWMDTEATVEETAGRRLLMKGNGRQAEVDALLVCVARKPNLEGLGLEEIGVAFAHGMPVFDKETLQIGDMPIFLAGDVNRVRATLHEAVFEGKALAESALEGARPLQRPVPMTITFCHPEIATVGLRWKELPPEGIAIGGRSFDDQGRARIEGRNQGLMRFYGDIRSGRLVGAEMIGPDVEHHAHWLALAMNQNMTVEALLTQPFYHPVTEEALRTGLADLHHRMQQT